MFSVLTIDTGCELSVTRLFTFVVIGITVRNTGGEVTVTFIGTNLGLSGISTRLVKNKFVCFQPKLILYLIPLSGKCPKA